MIQAMICQIRKYPARFTAAVQATLGILVILDIASEQVVGALVVIVSLWVAFWVHEAVTPMVSLPAKLEGAKAPGDDRSGEQIVFEIFDK